MKAKAVCVIRTDLRNSDGHKVPKGKLIAQGGHAFVGLLTKHIEKFPFQNKMCLTVRADTEDPLFMWLVGKFTKIVLAVGSEEELMEIYNKAKEAGLDTILIRDNGETEFAEPTVTCIGIGPDWSDKIDLITGHLRGFS